MSRKIYEFKVMGYYENIFCKCEYTIVYENKTFYYCKENGTDLLKYFYKTQENSKALDGGFWSTADFEINKALEEQKLKHRARDIEDINRQISRTQEELDKWIRTKLFIEKGGVTQ